jgi:site-specific recombinase XerD
METIKNEIKRLILKFENEEITLKFALIEINTISPTKIDEYDLQNYSTSTDLDDFVEELSMPQITDWREIDDNEASKLITEIKENIINSALVNRNINALEKRYKKSQGIISDWIFYDDIMENEKILELLKKDTTITL